MVEQTEESAQGSWEQALDAARRKRRSQMLVAGGAIGGIVVLALLGMMGAQLVVERDDADQTPDDAPVAVRAPAADATCRPSVDGCTREDFLDALRRFNDDYKAPLQAVSLSVWDPQGAMAIDALEDDALRAFDAGSYGEANVAIGAATRAAQEALAAADQRFARQLRIAEQAFDEEDHELAAQAIEQALLIEPNDEAARVLGQRIEVLPQVAERLERARVAAIENRPTDQAQHLREVLALDPLRSDVREQLAALDRASQAAQYAAAVSAAESALARGRLGDAQRAVAKARRVDPSKNLDFLQTRIDALATERRLQEALASAQRARAQDDWTAAQDAYQAALAINGSDAQAVAGVQDAQDVLRSLKRLRPYLDDPLRIGSKKVTPAAQRVQAEVAEHRGLSAELDRQLGALENYLRQVREPVKVTLVSDGLTDMSVRTVGRVGKHRRATIELTPGRYQLEGTREGYRSKLVTVEVGFGADQVEVRVVCDEPVA